MGEIRIKEQSPTLAVTFREGRNKERSLGFIGHPLGDDTTIDWKNCKVKHQKDGLVITLKGKS